MLTLASLLPLEKHHETKQKHINVVGGDRWFLASVNELMDPSFSITHSFKRGDWELFMFNDKLHILWGCSVFFNVKSQQLKLRRTISNESETVTLLHRDVIEEFRDKVKDIIDEDGEDALDEDFKVEYFVDAIDSYFEMNTTSDKKEWEVYTCIDKHKKKVVAFCIVSKDDLEDIKILCEKL